MFLTHDHKELPSFPQPWGNVLDIHSQEAAAVCPSGHPPPSQPTAGGLPETSPLGGMTDKIPTQKPTSGSF